MNSPGGTHTYVSPSRSFSRVSPALGALRPLAALQSEAAWHPTEITIATKMANNAASFFTTFGKDASAIGKGTTAAHRQPPSILPDPEYNSDSRYVAKILNHEGMKGIQPKRHSMTVRPPNLVAAVFVLVVVVPLIVAFPPIRRPLV